MYYSIGQYYKNRFGEKVYKLSIGLSDTCSKSATEQRCIYCDQWGSAAYPEQGHLDVREQILSLQSKIRARYNASKFLVYFQSFTTTCLELETFQKSVESALKVQDIVGIVVGTRPDTISDDMLDFLTQLSKKAYVSVEIGAQSFFDHHLDFLRRGHGKNQTVETIQKLSVPKNIDIGLHLMLGLPNETSEEIIETARLISSLPIQSVKLHNLHVLKNTDLESDFNDGLFHPIDLDTYTSRAILFLRHLSPKIAIHRLAAVASRWEELVAPEWNKGKMMVTQRIIDEMAHLNARQGDQC